MQKLKKEYKANEVKWKVKHNLKKIKKGKIRKTIWHGSNLRESCRVFRNKLGKGLEFE